MRKELPPEMMAIVERQVGTWELSAEVQERMAREHALARIPREVHPYIAVAREAGTPCDEITRIASVKLGVERLDREILTYMAERYNLSEGMLENVDENTSVWLRDVFGHWLDERVVSQSKYVAHLGQIVLLSARSGSVMFVGRGAHFFLPRERGLLVYIVAPLKRRVAWYMEEHDLSPDEATREVEKTDRERREFIHRYFHRDVADPHLYDLVINAEHFSAERAADLIVEEYRHRFDVS